MGGERPREMELVSDFFKALFSNQYPSGWAHRVEVKEASWSYGPLTVVPGWLTQNGIPKCHSEGRVQYPPLGGGGVSMCLFPSEAILEGLE